MIRRRRRTPPAASSTWRRRIGRWSLKAAILFVGGSLLWVALYRFVPPPVTATMIANAGGGRGIHKDWMPLRRIDPDMARAVIGSEDWRFCAHSGFDWGAMNQAFRSNLTGKKRLRGGSTISQQTAKNAFLWQGGGYLRKGLEAWFTLLIEAIWGKRRIMEVYLNIAETGIGTYGANAGAQRYFGHDASRLSATEAARIAAVLPLPKRREAVGASGFTRRYGDRIARRIGTVRRQGYDACLR
ncbi:MAG: monofunctional biosynthetic peptidoglycan transglycosylase [Sphingomonas fennica]